MHKHKHGPRMRGPWHGLHGMLWIIGLVVLFRHGWWWPGILVLIGISMILESVFSHGGLQTFEGTQQPKAPSVPPIYPPVPPAAPISQAPAEPAHRVELLPATCGQCGAPIRAHEVKWTGRQSAACSYCGANLSLKKI